MQFNEYATTEGQLLADELNDDWLKHRDANKSVEKFDEALTEHAVLIAGYGVSHRKRYPIQVGAIYVVETYHGLFIAEGSNNSPYRGAPKDCAEMSARRMARNIVSTMLSTETVVTSSHSESLWRVTKAFVAAYVRPGANLEINDVDAPTLQPCSTPCLPELSADPAFSPETVFTTIAVDPDTYNTYAREEHTVGQLTEVYRVVRPPHVSQDILQATA